MLAPASSLGRSPLVLAALAVLSGVLATAARHRPPAGLPMVRMDGWSVTDLVGHLQSRGLELQAVGSSEKGPITNRAFLLQREKPWKELAGLVKDLSRLDTWKGVVFCERVLRPETADSVAHSWEGACLRADPFLFFGDPQLLAAIRSALGISAGQAAEEEKPPQQPRAGRALPMPS